jgi:hypothetical protein
MSFNTLISGTHKKTSRPSVSSSRRAARKDNTLESNDGNKFIIKVLRMYMVQFNLLFKNSDNSALLLKILEKLNKQETDFSDMKKSQSNIEKDIKKINEEMCLLTNDKEFMEVNNFINNFNEISKFHNY